MNEFPKTIPSLFLTKTSSKSNRKILGEVKSNTFIKELKVKDYYTKVELYSLGLSKIGINTYEKVGIFSPSNMNWHLIDISSQCNRCVTVPIHHTLKPEAIKHIINHSDISCIFVQDPSLLQKLINIIKYCPKVTTIIYNEEIKEKANQSLGTTHNLISLKDLAHQGILEKKLYPNKFIEQCEEVKAEDISTIVYTTDESGIAKGAVITHNAFCSMLKNIYSIFKNQLSHNDRSLNFLPLSTILGRCNSMLSLTFGLQNVYGREMESLLKDLQVVKPTIIITIPRVLEKIYNQLNIKYFSKKTIESLIFSTSKKFSLSYHRQISRNRSPKLLQVLGKLSSRLFLKNSIHNLFGGSLRFLVTGGHSIDKEIVNFFMVMDITVLEGFGLTETIAPCSLNPLNKQISGTVGLPVGDMQLKLAADNQILISGEAMFKEYYKDQTATNNALKDGWFHSNVKGNINSEGYLTITSN